jgi:hypothetical protein
MSSDGGVTDRVQFTLYLDKQRECLRCNDTFSLRFNFGTHQCKGYHPLSTSLDGRYYECCKRRPGSPGCCPADHIDRMYEGQRPLTHAAANRTLLTADKFRLLGVTTKECDQYVQRASWRRDTTSGGWVIDRIDFKRDAEQRNLLAQDHATPVQYARDWWRPAPEVR